MGQRQKLQDREAGREMTIRPASETRERQRSALGCPCSILMDSLRQAQPPHLVLSLMQTTQLSPRAQSNSHSVTGTLSQCRWDQAW